MSKIDTLVAELCPDGVEYRKLGEIEDNGYLKLGRGKVISKKDIAANPGNYPIYSASAANDGKMGEYGSYMFEDVRLTWSVDGGGKFFYRDTPKYSVTNVCGWLKVLDEQSFSTRFLYHVLSSQWSTMTFDYVTKAHPSVIRELYQIPVVPLSIQRVIVRILDSFAELEAELEARKAQYAYYRDRLLSQENLEAIDGKPVEMKRLNDISINGPMYGSNTKAVAYDSNTGFRYIRITDIDDTGNLGDDLKSPEVFDEKYLLKNGDLLFARSGATAGKTMLYCDTMGPAVFAGYLIRFEIDSNQVLPRFAFHSVRTQRYWDWANAAKGGGAQPNISAKAYGNFEIPVPSLETQRKVVDILDRFNALTTSLTDGLPAEIEARKAQYGYYRDRLLDFPRKEVAS